ncbi:MAG: hypothetical protein ACXWX9_01285 [Actinomycetota bacterium]
MTIHRDERGLIGKILVLWLVVFALVVVATVDGAAILLSRVRTADLARDVAAVGARSYEETGRERAALRAALAALADADEDARLEDFTVSQRGEVSVVVTDHAGTLLVGRIGFLEDLAESRSSASNSG